MHSSMSGLFSSGFPSAPILEKSAHVGTCTFDFFFWKPPVLFEINHSYWT